MLKYKYAAYESRYHWFVPFSSNTGNDYTVMDWCYAEFGPQVEERWAATNHRCFEFVIRRDDDALAFRMRWC
jgi:hypothetical protein